MGYRGKQRKDYSRITSQRNIYTVSLNINTMCVELNYLKIKQLNEKNILLLIMDLTKSPPARRSGKWKNLIDSGAVDLVFALALLHHLKLQIICCCLLLLNFYLLSGDERLSNLLQNQTNKLNCCQPVVKIFSLITMKHISRIELKLNLKFS